MRIRSKQEILGLYFAGNEGAPIKGHMARE